MNSTVSAAVPDAAFANYDAIGDAVARLDYVRRSPIAGGAQRHKEWQHFVLLDEDLDLLVNFSCCDDPRPHARPGREFPRLVLLARDRDWDGDVETFPTDRTRVRGGRIDMALGENRLRFEDGRFRIDVALEDRPVTVHLDLQPATMPAFVPSIPMIEGPPLNWVVVPRLRASGEVTIGTHHHVLRNAPTYHDHNWGEFLWGHDVSWEWGFVLPEDDAVPWCLTFVRLTNRSRTRALAQQMLVWRRDSLHALFRESDLRLTLGPSSALPASLQGAAPDGTDRTGDPVRRAVLPLR